MTLNMTPAGPQPTSPSVLQQNLLADVAATNPGYTANLPGTLIEDIASTSVGAQVQMDAAMVDAVNNVSPLSTNPYTLALFGQQLGLPQGLPTNTSVYVVFTGVAGYAIPPGFLVGDGSHTYSIVDGGVIQSNGTSLPLFCVATQSGIWAIAANTVTTVLSSVPTGYTMTVTNPNPGTPGTVAESVQSYRSRILQGQQVTAQSVPAFVSTLLQAVPGVQARLVRVLQAGGGWEILCGGGDPYSVAYAILQSVLDLGSIVGSQISSSRNVQASIVQGNNLFDVTYVNPPQQTCGIALSWNTDLANFTAASQVSSLAIPAVINYVNSIIVGSPLSEFGVFQAFTTAVANILPVNHLTTFSIAVTINGAKVNPEAGTYIYLGDPESYLYATPTSITVQQA